MKLRVSVPMAVRALIVFFLVPGKPANAHSWVIPEMHPAPTGEEILKANGLHDALQPELTRYAQTHWDEYSGFWIPYLTAKEKQELIARYTEMLDGKKPLKKTAWEDLNGDLKKRRLLDKRRVLDTVLRELGRRGAEEALPVLLQLSKHEERSWVRWKALASVVEILSWLDPGNLDQRTVQNIDPNIIAPLLDDLDPGTAGKWAWFLQERWKGWLSVSYRSRVPLATRLRLAKASYFDHPEEAKVTFEEGLNSHDLALQTLTHFLIRKIAGGSIAYGSSSEAMLSFLDKAKPGKETEIWDVLPAPLDSPFLMEHWGGRTDLIFLNPSGEISKTNEDVFPRLKIPLPNGLNYTRIGESNPRVYGLANQEGRIFSRVSDIRSKPVLSKTGGLVTLAKMLHITESDTTGKLLWECLLEKSVASYRFAAPFQKGTFLLLGYNILECRDRRGDILWSMSMEERDDPRWIMALDTDRFLLACTNSVGILKRTGEYREIVTDLISTTEVQYHPAEPWVIRDGGNVQVIIVDPENYKETGRFDLDDSGTGVKSRFKFPKSYFPE